MYQQIFNARGMVDSVVRRLADNTYIPSDTGNIDYQTYLKWLAEGNEPLQPDAPMEAQQ